MDNPWKLAIIYLVAALLILASLCSCRSSASAVATKVASMSVDSTGSVSHAQTERTNRVVDSVIIERVITVRDSTVDRVDSTGSRTLEYWHFTTDTKAVNRLQRVIDSLRTALADTVVVAHVQRNDSIVTATKTITQHKMSAAQTVFFCIGLAAAILLVIYIAYRIRR